MAKLTLSVESDVIKRAKRFASRQGSSVSELVERYLDFISRTPDVDLPPGLRSVRGVMQRGTRADYRRHLETKHR
jgi:hypothetical protein